MSKMAELSAKRDQGILTPEEEEAIARLEADIDRYFEVKDEPQSTNTDSGFD